ncbi:bifunctional serine/threonine-protein kinase/universal stress protein [Terrarubrum flagellatum]|uniref:bifunctional serine/threonine-protein kinase/universal stress protein n=1 Tax=Terrirubrum flagellatum TaxID=2895980 RepID=UPI0031453FCA
MARNAIATGDEIDGFRIGRKLHQGGMAAIFEAARADLAFPAVMKVPLILDGDNPAMIVGFEVEQMILPRLSGPHAPRFVAAGDFATHRPYLVMERIEGESLYPRFEAAPLAIEEVVEIGARVADALGELHRQHVVHLDLKPSNIMRRPSGEMAFIDFGLSRHLQLPDLLAEEFRVPFGTAPYISPEQVLGVRTDKRSDLFALGVLLYHLSTGRRPFGNPRNVRGLRKRLYQIAPPPRSFNPDYPPWLQEIVLRLIEADPEKRYQRSSQVSFDLRNPLEVTLTRRANRTSFSGWRNALRWWSPFSRPYIARAEHIPDMIEDAPIILAAVDLAPDVAPLAEALRDAVRIHAAAKPEARVICATVLKTNRIAVDVMVDSAGRSLHVQKLIDLKNWAQPLAGLGADRLSYHVLEHPDPGDAIIDFAVANQVDHIFMGARGSSSFRRHLGSVSAKIVSEAPCSATVIRLAQTGN